MQNSLKLFNPEENVFGELSNNFKYKIEIDRKQWDSVTQYIYTHMVDSPVYQNILKNFPLKFIVNKSSEFSKIEINDAISLFLDEALSEKFKDEKVTNLLISTGQVPIFYISNNTFLGMNDKGEGLNLYGKKLMQIRASLIEKKLEKDKENKENLLYKSYTAFSILKSDFENGVNLEKYSGLNIDEIINKYLGNNDIQTLNKKLNIPDKNLVLELINFNFDLEETLNTSLEYPEILLLKVKTPDELQRLKYKQENLKKNLMFDLYVDSMIQKHYSSLTEDKYKVAKHQQFAKLNYKKRDMFADEVLKRYMNKQLSSELIDKINSAIKDFYIPSEAEIKIAKENSKFTKKSEPKNIISKEFLNNKEERILLNKLHEELGVPEDSKMTWEELNVENTQLAKEISDYVKTRERSLLQRMIDDMRSLHSNPIKKQIKTFSIGSLDANNPFSLIHPVMLNIKNSLFPSISHYITLNLISKKLKLPLVDVYNKYMLININVKPTSFKDFIQIDRLNEIFFHVGNVADKDKLKKYAKTALDKKFANDKHLQDLLLSTGNKNIIWNDDSDNILGVGENFVGKYLMELRQKISKNAKEETIDNDINDSDILKILENDHIQKWLIMKIKDVCKTIQFVKKYKKIKKVNVKIVEDILDKIYQPCSYIFNISKDIEINVPVYFKDIIANMGSDNYDERENNMCSEELNDDNISILLWKRIISILYIIVNNLNTSSDKDVTITKILNTLYVSQIVGSSNKNCVEIIANREDNCIVSAVTNLLQHILNFNKILNNNNIVTKSDINLASSIIINFDILQIKQYHYFKKSKIDMMEESEVQEYDYDVEKNGNEIDYNGDVPEDEDDGDKSEIDYGDESEDEDEDKKDSDKDDAYSAKNKKNVSSSHISINNVKYNEKDMKKLSFYLQENKVGDIEYDNIAKYILQSAIIIKNFKMPINIKKNRINFFSK